MTRLSTRFRSLKNRRRLPPKSSSSPLAGNSKLPASSSGRRRGSEGSEAGLASKWSVYLIISSRLPKTYVGVTTNFSRRLKQHNGELKGGAKASSAGRPWGLACIVRGFKGQSEGRGCNHSVLSLFSACLSQDNARATSEAPY